MALLSTPSVLPLPIEQIVYWETEHDSPRNIFKKVASVRDCRADGTYAREFMFKRQ